MSRRDQDWCRRRKHNGHHSAVFYAGEDACCPTERRLNNGTLHHCGSVFGEVAAETRTIVRGVLGLPPLQPRYGETVECVHRTCRHCQKTVEVCVIHLSQRLEATG